MGSSVNVEVGPTVGGGPLSRRSLGALGSGLVSLLLYGSLFVLPLVGLLVAPLGLIPVLQYSARHTSGVAAWGWVAALLGVTAAAGGGTAGLVFFAGYVTVIVLPALAVEWWRRAGWSDGRWAAAAGFAGLVFVLAAVVGLAWPQAPVPWTTAWLRTAGEQALQLYQKLGVSRGGLQLALDASERNLTWILPALPVTYLVTILFWVRPRLPLLGFAWKPVPFEEYRNDDWLPVTFVLGGIGTLALAGTGRWVAVNVLATVLILYFVQGLAIIRAHLVRYLGRGWFVRWGIALLCLQVPLPVFVAALGIADSFFSLRPRRSDEDGRAS